MKPKSHRRLAQMMMPWHPGITISTQRAAEIIGYSKHTIIRMIEDGTIEGYKFRPRVKGSHYCVVAESAYRFAEARRRLGPDPLTVEEAAAILFCSARTVRSMIRNQEIFALKKRDNLESSGYEVCRADVVALTHAWRQSAAVADAPAGAVGQGSYRSGNPAA